MSRPINEQRPEELREAIVEYLIKNGLTNLSLRPLAKAIGTSPRGLLYHFGSKEKMIVEAIAGIRTRQRANLNEIERPTFSESCWETWKQLSADDSVPLFRLFFEVYGVALRNPQSFEVFLRDTVEDWLRVIAEPLVRSGVRREEARAFATVVLAGLRGFMLDYCTTGDRDRLDRAVRLWVCDLDAMVPSGNTE